MKSPLSAQGFHPFFLIVFGLPQLLLAQASVPRPDHVLIVMEENVTFSRVLSSPSLQYMHRLIGQGALFITSYALTHPSEPNYLGLFSGSTQGVGDDSCPHTFGGPNLGSQLFAAGLTFVGYAEDLPAVGSGTCESGGYVRRHCPWVNFSNLPHAANRPFSTFPTNFDELPTVCFVIPTVQHDLHSGSGAAADGWLFRNIDPYVRWAATHNSLLIVSWDEGDQTHNQIATFLVGPMVQPGRYGERITHYTVLRTIEEMYGLAPLGAAAHVEPMTSPWKADSIQSPLTIELDSPMAGQRVFVPTNIELAATASSTGRSIRAVEFFQRAQKLGEVTNAPFHLTWTNPPSGDYSFAAHVIDDNGQTRWSRSVAVRVVSTPYPDAQGNYAGLFYETDGVRAARSGRVAVTLTKFGTYSGTLQWAGHRQGFSGALDWTGQATNQVEDALGNLLELELAFDLSGTGTRLTGRLMAPDWMAPLQAGRAVFSSLHRAPWADHYTVMLPDDDTAADSPSGDGVGFVVVTDAGLARWVGTLADGTPFTQSATLSSDGAWPLFAPIYANQGLILGWLHFTNGPAPGLGGRTIWIKPTVSLSKYYPGGFTNQSDVLGSVYHPPAGTGGKVVTFADGQIQFSEGNQPAPFTNVISILGHNQFTNLSSNALNLAFHPATGLLSGYVVDPWTGRRSLLKSAVLQNQDIAVGFCLGTNLSGSVLLESRTGLEQGAN